MTNLTDNFKAKLNESQEAALLKSAKSLNVNVNWLAAVIYFETAGTMSPKTKNQIGSIGLIQFTRDSGTENGHSKQYKTINGHKYQLIDIAKMTFELQMELVTLYLKPFKSNLKQFIDLYLAVFFPAALGKPLEFLLKTSQLSSSLIAAQNPIFDLDKDNKIYKGEIIDFFQNYFNLKYGLGFFQNQVNLKKKA